MPEDCLFCRIVAGDEPAHVVLDDEVCVAFLDSRPLFHGHTLLVPRDHHETLWDLPPSWSRPYFERASAVSVAVRDAMGAQGAFVAMNNVVSQSVPHLHCHVVPRGRRTACAASSGRDEVRVDEQAAEVAAKIRETLTGELEGGVMDVQETIAKARDAITVKRVYGDPYERDGVTVIPLPRTAVARRASSQRAASERREASSPPTATGWATAPRSARRTADSWHGRLSMRLVLPVAVGGYGDVRGRTMLARSRRSPARVDGRTRSVYVDLGDRVLVLLTREGRTVDGTDFAEEGATMYVIESGRLRRMELYADRALALTDAGITEAEARKRGVPVAEMD